jgi:hypothetical protein
MPFLLLWLLFAQALGAARAASITFDEGPHLAVGYATLRSGDLRLQPVHIHPPLANVLAAAPLLLNPDLPDPRTIPGWEIASLSAVTDAVVWQYPHPERLALAGRLPIILLTLLTAALVWRWAADLAGEWGGLLALALFTFDPNVVAHGSLVTTDMAVTAFGLAAFFLLHRYLRRQVADPCRGKRQRLWALLVGVGLALGLALASKVSAALLVLLVGAVLFIEGGLRLVASHRERRPLGDPPRGSPVTPPQRGGNRGGGLRAWLVAAGVPFIGISLIAALTLWAVYGFELRPLPEAAGAISLPAATHLEIYRSLQEHYRLGHPAFLMGQNSDQGWWYYFPVASLIKTPLPTLILLGLALILFIRRLGGRPQGAPTRSAGGLALTLFPPVYMVTALFSSVDIGYRHLLPMLPFIDIFIGSTFYDMYSVNAARLRKYLIPNTQRAARIILSALLLWLVVGTALVYPYPLTFFNRLAGGPEGGYRWLVDSNLDWGQNLWGLRDWMRAERVGEVNYSHFSPAQPEVYGISADWLPPDPRAMPFAPFDPASGVYAIGATTLQGAYTPDVNTFAFFRARQPDAVLDHALFIYRVPEHPVPDWAAVCFDAPLNAGQIRDNFGQPDLRLTYFDCHQSQVYPAGEEGRFLLPPEAGWPNGADLVLQARYADGRSAFTLLRSPERPMPEWVAGPADVDGPLSFLGYELDQTQVRRGEEVVLRTFWRVDGDPGRVAERSERQRPLSIMAHLLGPDGVLVAVGDGLGVPVEGWQPGDQIVQNHRLSVPSDAPTGDYTLQTGAYWLDTLERWPVRAADGTRSDHILLDKITILD